MADAVIKEVALREEIQAGRREGYLFGQEEVKSLVSRYDFNFVGSGGECAVIESRKNPEWVVAINYRDLPPNEAKTAFYLQRIFSTLFPHNFPHFFSSYGVAEGATSRFAGSVRQKIITTPKSGIESSENFWAHSTEAKYPIERVIEFCRQYTPDSFMDTSGSNFVLADDGGAYYLDTLKLNPYPRTWDLDLIMKYMNECLTEAGEPQYSQTDREIVENSLHRLAQLGLIKIKDF